MGMKGERRSPGVQYGGNADARAKMLGISRNRDHRLGGSLEQEIIDDGLVLVGDVVDDAGSVKTMW